jgi:rifampicin phosphotransferase
MSDRSAPLVIDLADVPADSMGLVGHKAARLAELVRSGFRVPGGVVVTTAANGIADDEVLGVMPSLGDDARFAVRSSAVAEDLDDASFAGQYRTELDVTRAGLPAAVGRVRASSVDAAVDAYRAARGVRGEDGAIAALIQPMIAARAAGVAFSADPVSGDRSTVVVTAVRGIGDALVSGTADADEWDVRAGRASVRRQPAGILDEALVSEVADLARRVADRAGEPQDIEWAHDGRELWLLQARPLTGLPPIVAWEAGVPGVFTRNLRFGEWIGGPVTSLFESWLLTTMEERLHEIHAREFGMLAPRPRHVIVNGWYFYSLEFLPLTLRALRRSLPGLLRRTLRNPRRGLIWLGPLARFGAPIFEREWREELAPRYAKAVEDASARVETASPDELVRLVDELAVLAGESFSSITVVAGSVYKDEMFLARFYGRHLAPRIGGSHLALLGAATGPVAPPPHAVTTIDWAYPTLGELGGQVLASVPAERLVAAVRDRDAARSAAREALGGSARRRRSFERMLARADHGARVREEQVAAWTAPWPAMRRAIVRLGERLVTTGALGSVDDVWFLTRVELVDALGSPDRAPTAAALDARRRAVSDAGRLSPPVIIGRPSALIRRLIVDGRRDVGAATPDDRTLLIGVPASPGRVTGRVRVIHDPAQGDALEPGEILVAPVTAPAWTPLFARAAAVVTDIGSVQAHASIIAREYAIPAVVGCGDATRRLVDGQLVTVDGAAGRVDKPER